MNKYLRSGLACIFSALFACGGEGGERADGSSSMPKPAGLHVVESAEGRVAGEFVGDAVTTHFDLLQSGSDLALQVSDASEQPLFRIESTPQKFVFDYFAGALTLSGPASVLNADGPLFGADGVSPPEQLDVVGDLAVLSDFRALPERASIDELMDALYRGGYLGLPLGSMNRALETPEADHSAGVEARNCNATCPATMPACQAKCRIETLFSGSFTRCRRTCFSDTGCDTCF